MCVVHDGRTVPGLRGKQGDWLRAFLAALEGFSPWLNQGIFSRVMCSFGNAQGTEPRSPIVVRISGQLD